MLKFLKRTKPIIKKFGTGCYADQLDLRDRKYDEVVAAETPMTDKEWQDGFNIEKELDFELPIKNQNGSSSCTGQAWSYYAGILNLVETKTYKEVSAKAIYSQTYLTQGGAYLRDGARLIVNWGALLENVVMSYENNKPPSENFMRDLLWKNEITDKMAKTLQAKEYRVITACDNMDIFARAIKNNYGVVGGLYVGNSDSWGTNEPKPTARDGGHALYYGKFGIDELGKYIATPNSWGRRSTDILHQDGWQKLRQDYFNNIFQFNPWTILDKPNIEVNVVDAEIQKILNSNEKKIIIEGQGVGRKGIIIDGKLKEIIRDRESAACLYGMANNNIGSTISTDIYNKLPKGGIF